MGLGWPVIPKSEGENVTLNFTAAPYWLRGRRPSRCVWQHRRGKKCEKIKEAKGQGNVDRKHVRNAQAIGASPNSLGNFPKPRHDPEGLCHFSWPVLYLSTPNFSLPISPFLLILLSEIYNSYIISMAIPLHHKKISLHLQCKKKNPREGHI